MSLSDSQESLLLATILSGEDRKDKARRSSFSWDLAKLYAQGSPVFVEFIRLAKRLHWTEVFRLRGVQQGDR
jgi:hypothetical protein